MNLYVYYRVRPGQEAACAAAVSSLQAELGMPRRLLRRADDPATWMEIYEDVAPDFPPRLEAASQARDFAAYLAGDGCRHVERFVECA